MAPDALTPPQPALKVGEIVVADGTLKVSVTADLGSTVEVDLGIDKGYPATIGRARITRLAE